jgi:hypothetical protein
LDRVFFGHVGLTPGERGKHPSRAIHIYADFMRPKNVSYKQKRHFHTFYLARRDPERWEKERNTTFSETLHEAQERAGIAETEAEINKTSLEDIQQQVSLVTIHNNGL